MRHWLRLISLPCLLALGVWAWSPAPTAAATKVSFSVSADSPSCADCGSIMVRNGSCYKCLNCGSTSGCS